MRLFRYLVAALLVAAVIGAPQVLAQEASDIGYLDQTALAGVPAFQNANRQFTDFRNGLQKQFERRARKARSASDQQKLAAEFQSRLGSRQRELFGPLFAAAQTAIASIASSRALSVVVDKRIVIVGGQDITKNVIDLLNSPGSPVPPVNTPPPSTVGWVDQSQIDQLDAFKSAQNDFAKFADDQRKSAQDKLKGAKTDADRQKIYADYQKSIDAQRDKLVTPLVDKTRAAIASVARKRNLILVIDRSNLIFGGTDVTSDVVALLKK
ncbi:MAG: OmpH family outer membrane protein [Candidatus Eremiobacteraeota bacterium]|nr:OmpH family outer membrane protein [Candidatus Eremiobacteraeota bacterium]MBV8354763.1 OmpH family outer membrane protein [Candidatus Eremiobacteraeota bacterium]